MLIKHHAEYQYLENLQKIYSIGYDIKDRTGVGCRFISGTSLRHDFVHGFPLLTTKKMFWRGILHEFLWIIKGNTNIKYLQDNGVNIWNEWADENGDLGPIYGKQMRNCAGIDQLQEVINGIRECPYSRRHLISLWSPPDLEESRLPPCHGISIHFIVRPTGHVDLLTYQRSADYFLGVPFNIASYSLLLHVVCHLTNYKLGHLVYYFGHSHIYHNHFKQVAKQLTRSPFQLPEVRIKRHVSNIDDFEYDDFQLLNYTCDLPIKAEVAV